MTAPLNKGAKGRTSVLPPLQKGGGSRRLTEGFRRQNGITSPHPPIYILELRIVTLFIIKLSFYTIRKQSSDLSLLICYFLLKDLSWNIFEILLAHFFIQSLNQITGTHITKYLSKTFRYKRFKKSSQKII